MAKNRTTIRLLAVVSSDFKDQMRQYLDSPEMSPAFVSRAEELRHLVRDGEIYEVALLPAALPEGIDWWTIWGELALLARRPIILVYAPSANFHLWSEVLDAGGYDVVVEPYTSERLREAVRCAALSFDLACERDLSN